MAESVDKLRNKNFMDRSGSYQKLVDELMLDAPNENRVKELMSQLDIEYKKDPIERINLVLKALHGVPN